MTDLRALLYQHPKGVTVEEIAAHLRVTSRSARRYLNEIKLDLESVAERPRGPKRWRIPAADVPRRVAIRRTQAYALLAARALFEPMQGSALFEEIDLVIQTLLGLARRPGRGPNAGVAEASLEHRFAYLPFAPKNYAERADDLDNVFHAVSDLRPLHCRLRRTPDGVLERTLLHPYALLLYKDAIHCLAWHPDKQRVMPLVLDLLRDCRCVEDEHFELPPDFRVDDYVQGQFGIWRGGSKPQQVVIELDATVRDMVLTRRLHPSQAVEQLDDGRVRLSLQLDRLDEVASWVLGFGSLARVLAPPELRTRVKQQLEAALAHYR